MGVLKSKTPTRISERERFELWLCENADRIENVMTLRTIQAEEAIFLLIENEKAYCRCCGEHIPRATSSRHFLCKKHPQCRKARRYYSYLVHEKGVSKDVALNRAIQKFKQIQE